MTKTWERDYHALGQEEIRYKREPFEGSLVWVAKEKITDWAACRTTEMYSSRSWRRGKSEIRGLVDSASGEGPLPGSQVPRGRRGEKLCGSPLLGPLFPFMRAPPSRPNHLPDRVENRFKHRNLVSTQSAAEGEQDGKELMVQKG